MMLQRIEKTGLFALMVAGSLALWIVIPAGILWGLGELVETKTEHLLLGIPAVAIGMILCGLLLAALNNAYLSLGEQPDGDEDTRGGPVELIVVGCAAAALLAFVGWMVFGTEGVAPLW